MRCYAKVFRVCVIRAFEKAFQHNGENPEVLANLLYDEMTQVADDLTIVLQKIMDGKSVCIFKFLKKQMSRPLLYQTLYNESIINNANNVFKDTVSNGPFIVYKIGQYKVHRYMELPFASVYKDGQLIVKAQVLDYIGNVIKFGDKQYLYVGEGVVYTFVLDDTFVTVGDHVVYGKRYTYLLKNCAMVPTSKVEYMDPYQYFEREKKHRGFLFSQYDVSDEFLQRCVPFSGESLSDDEEDEEEFVIEEDEEFVIEEDEEFIIEEN